MHIGGEMSYVQCVVLVACVRAMHDNEEELDPRSACLLARLEGVIAHHGAQEEKRTLLRIEEK